jgi:anti-sigma regulatory factor (Ser/Thr protein kinase)
VTESVKLTVPHTRPYHHVVRLVVGGLAARLNISYEHLDDLQLALDGLIGNVGYAAAEYVTIEISLDERTLELVVGPLDSRKLEPDLAGKHEAKGEVGLHRLLSTVVGSVEVEQRDGAQWVRLRKEVGEGRVTTRT